MFYTLGFTTWMKSAISETISDHIPIIFLLEPNKNPYFLMWQNHHTSPWNSIKPHWMPIKSIHFPTPWVAPSLPISQLLPASWSFAWPSEGPRGKSRGLSLILRCSKYLIKRILVRELKELPSYERWSWLAFTPSCQRHHHVNHPSSSIWEV